MMNRHYKRELGGVYKTGLSSSGTAAESASPSTLLLYDEHFAGHDMGAAHPESPERFVACLAALKAAYDPAQGGDGTGLRWCSDSPHVTEEQLLRVHTPEYIEELRATLDEAAEDGITIALDPDTSASPGTREAVLRGSGGVCAAVDDLMSGAARNAFCLVRSPGHHAESDHAMGFCFVNNVMVAAAHALEAYPETVRRVAILDFDVHHGNGTAEQTVLRNIDNEDSAQHDVLYLSTHQHPHYPGTGESQTIDGMMLVPSDLERLGVVNAPMSPPGTFPFWDSSSQFREVVTEKIMPALRAFEPDLLILSAGWDGHVEDPLAGLELSDEDYTWVTGESLKVAEEFCEGRVLSVLEGGYHVPALARCVTAHVAQLRAEALARA